MTSVQPHILNAIRLISRWCARVLGVVVRSARHFFYIHRGWGTIAPRAAAIGLAITSVLLSTIQPPLMASADSLPQAYSYCGISTLGEWDWVSPMKLPGDTTPAPDGAGNMPYFDVEQSAYIAFSPIDISLDGVGVDPADYWTARYNNLTFIAAKSLTMHVVSGVPYMSFVLEPTAQTAEAVINYRGTDYTGSGENSVTNGGINPSSPPSLVIGNIYGTGLTYTDGSHLSGDINLSYSVGCIQAIHGATYDSTWTYAQPPADMAYADPNNIQCSSWDIGCWVGKVFTDFTNFFLPDPSALSASFSEFSTYMNDKLGFLLYPFTFIGDFFSAFTTASPDCTSTSCVRDFGSFMGADMVIDFNTFHNAAPTVWNWVKIFLQGTTVIGLIFMLRQKIMGILRH